MATSEPDAPQHDLGAAIARHRSERVHIVRGRAGALLRFEGATDLVSGLVVELLSRTPDFEARGPEADRAWLFEAARLHLANRRRHWSTLKRETSRLLRTGLQGGSETGPKSNPIEAFAASQTGPRTFAFRREQLVLLTQATAVLLPHDRRLVELVTADRSNEESPANWASRPLRRTRRRPGHSTGCGRLTSSPAAVGPLPRAPEGLFSASDGLLSRLTVQNDRPWRVADWPPSLRLTPRAPPPCSSSESCSSSPPPSFAPPRAPAR